MCDVTDVPRYIYPSLFTPINAVMFNLKLNLHRFNVINYFGRGHQ